MNEEVHLDENGDQIPVSDSEYIWLGPMTAVFRMLLQQQMLL